MASENVERLQLAFEAFARGDIDAVAENIDSDFQIEDSILIDGSFVGPGGGGFAGRTLTSFREVVR